MTEDETNPNLIINGDFENNPVELDEDGNGFGFFDAIEGWTPIFGQIEIQEGEVPTSDLGVAGNGVLELATDQNAGVQQTVTIADGAAGTYQLSLDHAQRSDDFSPAIFQVIIDDEIVATITPESGVSNTFTIDLDLDAGAHTIGLVEIGQSNGRGSLIDNVSLVAIAITPPPTPFLDTIGEDDAVGSDDADTLVLIDDGLTDTFDAAGGTDTLDVSGFEDGLRVDLSAEQTSLTSDTTPIDTVANFENIIGGESSDIFIGNDADNILTGADGNDELAGGNGNDTLIGGSGADMLSGGQGNDTASYADASLGITLDLANLATATGDAAGDVFSSIESIVGTSFSDTIIGDTFSNALSGNAGDDFITGGDEGSVTAEEAFVFRVYQATLDRAPDLGGFDFFSGALTAGTLTEAEIVDFFVSSAEFQATFGMLDDAAFVELLFNNVLNRPADPATLTGILADLTAGVSRASVVADFIDSAEFIEASTPLIAAFSSSVINADIESDVFNIYQAALGRQTDAGGIAFFAENLLNGNFTSESVLSAIVNSAEFQQNFGTLSNTELVESLYQNALGRASDPGGLAFFVGLLDAGASIESVITSFLESPEFATIPNDDLDAFLSSITNNLTDIISGGTGNDDLVGGIGGDTFVYDTTTGGQDRVLDFSINGGDVIDLQNTEITSVAELVALGTQDGADAVFDFGGGNTLRLANVNLNDLDADDFQFPNAPAPAPDPLVLTVSAADGEVAEGETTDITVMRAGGDLSSELTVTLTSSDDSEASVPQTVTFAAGETSATVTLTGETDGLVDGDQSVTLTASAMGAEAAETMITVTDIDVAAPPPPPPPPPGPSGNLIVNGDFENNPVTLDADGNGFGFFDAIEGWTPTFGQIEIQEGVVPTSDLGIAGNAVLELATNQNAGVEQTVTVADGTEGVYTLSLDHAQRSDDFSPAIFNVVVDGVVVATVTPESGTANTFEIDLNLTAGEHTIGFEEIGVSNGRGSLIDNVELVATGAPLPAPTGPETISFAGEAGGRFVNLETAEWATPLRVLPLGDSITLGVSIAPRDVNDTTLGGYRDDLFNAFLGDGILIDYVGSNTTGPNTLLDQSHEGTSGIRADMLAPDLRGQISNFDPDIVLLMAGTNDSRQDPNNSGRTTPQDLLTLINIVLGQNPDAQIFVSTLIPQEPDGGRNTAALPAVAEANAGIVQLVADLNADGFDNIHLVDNSNLPLSLISDIGTDGINDVGVHPTDEGYAEIAQRWFDALNNAFDSLPDSLSGTLNSIAPAVQNIVGANGNDLLIGNDQSNEIDGGAGNDILDGGAGNDMLTGGSGRDIFLASEGDDTITDFQVGTDFVDLSDTGISNLAELLRNTTDTASGASISSGTGSITLEGVTLAQLTGDSFIFDEAGVSGAAASASVQSVDIGSFNSAFSADNGTSLSTQDFATHTDGLSLFDLTSDDFAHLFDMDDYLL